VDKGLGGKAYELQLESLAGKETRWRWSISDGGEELMTIDMVGLPNNFLIRLDPGSDDDEHEVASVDITTKKERYDYFRTIHLDAKVDEDDGEEKWDINGNAGDVWRYRFAAGTRANDNYGGHMEAGDGGKFVERTAVHASDEGYTFVEGDKSFWESFDAWNEQAYRPDSY